MQKKYLYFMALAHLSVDINTGSLPALLPFFAMQYGMDYKSIAGLMFASSFLSSIIQPIFGLMADKAERNWFMALGVLLSGISLGLTGFYSDYWTIFIAVTIMGIGTAIFHPEAARIVNSISGKNLGAGMSIFSVGGNSGFGLGPLLAVFLVSVFGIKGTSFYALISIIMATALFILVPKIKRTARILSNTGSSDKKDSPIAENDWSAFIRLVLVILFRSTVFCGISSFLPMFCINHLGSLPVAGSSTLSVLSLSGIIATLIGGRLADRFGYVTILKCGCMLMVPFLGIAVYSNSIYGVYAMLIPLSFALHGAYSSFVVLGQSYLAKNIGFASGITLGISFSIGGIMVPSLGHFADLYGIAAVMQLLVIIAFCAGMSCFLLPQPKNKFSNIK